MTLRMKLRHYRAVRITMTKKYSINFYARISLLSQKVFASFPPRSQGDSLADLAISLLKEQKLTWRLLADAYESLDSVKVREIHCNGFLALLQCNPKRIISTSANVDDKSVRERKCFLCFKNLPEEQKGVLYQDEFIILCNPAPIFPRHFTISTVRHDAARDWQIHWDASFACKGVESGVHRFLQWTSMRCLSSRPYAFSGQPVRVDPG